jgi:hypothetical protein
LIESAAECNLPKICAMAERFDGFIEHVIKNNFLQMSAFGERFYVLIDGCTKRNVNNL